MTHCHKLKLTLNSRGNLAPSAAKKLRKLLRWTVCWVAMSSISKWRRNEASIRQIFWYRIETNQLIPFVFGSKGIKKVYFKTFGSKEKTNTHNPKSSRSKRIEKVYPKPFWIEEKTNLPTPNYSGLKRIEKVYTKSFRIEEKTNLLIQKSSGSKRIEKVYSKTFEIEEKTNLHVPKCQRIEDKTNQKLLKLVGIKV